MLQLLLYPTEFQTEFQTKVVQLNKILDITTWNCAHSSATEMLI